jgi:hypothetical protein
VRPPPEISSAFEIHAQGLWGHDDEINTVIEVDLGDERARL